MEKEINELIKNHGADSKPLDILLAYVNDEISYWSALHSLGQMKYAIADIQTILIKELHPQIKGKEENSYYIRGFFNNNK